MIIDLTQSPHNLLQEQQLGKPFGVWRILVVCQLLNRTHGRQVRPMIEELWSNCPGPWAMMHADPWHLKSMLKPLGFAEQRFRNVRAMSEQYAEMLRADPQFWRGYENGDWCMSLVGCGTYARDSLNLVVYGVLDAPTTDHWLERYRKWKLERRDLIQRGLAAPVRT